MDNLDQYLISTSSPLNNQGNSVVSTDTQFDNAVGAVTFSQGRINAPLIIGGKGSGTAGKIQVYDNLGNQNVQIDSTGVSVFGSSAFIFQTTGAGTEAFFGPTSSNGLLLQTSIGIPFTLDSWGGTFNMTSAGGSTNGAFVVNGGTATFNTIEMDLNGDLHASNVILSQKMHSKDLQTDSNTIQIGTAIKTAIVPTSEGYRALYCAEAPEIWFFDFCDSKESIDPLFLEVTEGDMKFIKLEDGGYQVWRKRKGFTNTRFEPKTAEQFNRNEQFWSTPLS